MSGDVERYVLIGTHTPTVQRSNHVTFQHTDVETQFIFSLLFKIYSAKLAEAEHIFFFLFFFFICHYKHNNTRETLTSTCYFLDPFSTSATPVCLSVVSAAGVTQSLTGFDWIWLPHQLAQQVSLSSVCPLTVLFLLSFSFLLQYFLCPNISRDTRVISTSAQMRFLCFPP